MTHHDTYDISIDHLSHPWPFWVSPQRWGPAGWVSSNCARWTGSWRHPNLPPICRFRRGRGRGKARWRWKPGDMVKTGIQWRIYGCETWMFQKINGWKIECSKKIWLKNWMVTWAMSSEIPPCLRQIKTTRILRSRFFVMDPFTQGLKILVELKILVDPAIKGRLICHWWQASTSCHGQSYHIYGPRKVASCWLDLICFRPIHRKRLTVCGLDLLHHL